MVNDTRKILNSRRVQLRADILNYLYNHALLYPMPDPRYGVDPLIDTEIPPICYRSFSNILNELGSAYDIYEDFPLEVEIKLALKFWIRQNSICFYHDFGWVIEKQFLFNTVKTFIHSRIEHIIESNINILITSSPAEFYPSQGKLLEISIPQANIILRSYHKSLYFAHRYLEKMMIMIRESSIDNIREKNQTINRILQT